MRSITRKGKEIITFTYLEWVSYGKSFPPHDPDKQTEFIIREVPEDKKEFFESLGCTVSLYINKAKGYKRGS